MKGVQRLTMVAVVIPLLGLAALIGRAEVAVRSGPSWEIPITGYDPRDLLHGRFLRYRYQLNWRGIDTCGAGAGQPGTDRFIDAECCVCLSREPGAGVNPPARQVRCDEVEGCDGWLRSGALSGGQRYFVPEERALELEGALRDRNASLELTCGPGGEPAIMGLLLDGRPWRELLDP